MKISPYAQQTVEWLQARCGLPTASEFDNLVSPTGEVRKGKMPETYMNKKIAEWWTGSVDVEATTSFYMEQGKIIEEEVAPWYELEYGVKIERVGLITTDDGTVGCSPDGLLPDSGIEIKAPATHTHIGYLLAGQLPPEYIHQVQGCMYVTGRDEWKFVSYRRGMPALVLTVERDIKFQNSLDAALELFIGKMEAAKERLIEMNGSPPKRFLKPPPKPQPEFISEMPS